MNRYTTLLFDLDNTLLDFTKAEYICIKKLFAKYGLPDDDNDIKRYSEINDSYWKSFERGEIKAEQIYEARFDTYAAEKGMTVNAKGIAEDYLKMLSKCAVKKPFCDEILNYCKEKEYTIAVITNGIAENQHGRVDISGIKNYISHLFISEEIGAPKPEKVFFDKVFQELSEKDKSKILVIGDSPTSDINGAINAGLDSCFIGYADCGSTYKIKNLRQLKNII